MDQEDTLPSHLQEGATVEEGMFLGRDGLSMMDLKRVGTESPSPPS